MKRLVIDKHAVRANLHAVKNRAGDAVIYADLSGDAYGLGLLETARLLLDGGINNFAVSEPRDAALLRKSGFEHSRIMMVRSTADPDELNALIDLGVICTVGSYDAAVAINGIAEARGTVCEVQIKIDTGMGRYGFMSTEMERIIGLFKYMANLAIVGVYTTFAQSWRSKKFTEQQYDVFVQVINEIKERGYEPGVVQCLDSAALFNYEFDKMDAVRIGTAFSGRMPGKPIQSLKKVGYIEASVEEVGWFPKGHRFGGKKTLRKPAKLAVISVGFFHGFGLNRHDADSHIFDIFRNRRRRLTVKINGRRAKVMGSVGMMHTVVDVTRIKCSVGDHAVMDVDPVNVKGLPRVYIG